MNELRRSLTRPVSYTMYALCGVIAVHAVFYYASLFFFHGRITGVDSWVFALGSTYARWFPWFFALPLAIWLAKLYLLEGPRLWRNLLIHFVAMWTVSALVVLAGLAAVYLGIRIGPTPGGFLSRLAYLASFEMPTNMTVYVTTVAMTQVSIYYRRAHDRELATLALEARLLRAELDALRSQLNPHFMFNALNAVAELIPTDRRAAEQMVVALASFMRRLVDISWTQITTLRAELALLHDYLDVARFRYDGRMGVEIDAPPELADAAVPHMVLQPLVENSLKHGSRGGERPVSIRVTARQRDARLVLTVQDDGPGPDAASAAAGSRTGLANLRERLAAMYGEDQRLEIAQAPGGGCRVTLDLPLVPGDAAGS